jgi:hypothetical protein
LQQRPERTGKDKNEARFGTGTAGKQVTLLRDIQGIENLQRIYAYYFDSHQYDKVMDLFSDNAESAEI